MPDDTLEGAVAEEVVAEAAVEEAVVDAPVVDASVAERLLAACQAAKASGHDICFRDVGGHITVIDLDDV